ncbi:putative sodium-coupled neutral amino acid transporter 10 [Gigantopelta aegis]|uniref:putative sodium-coupled neutral amino acid transporter 10 n=1 Tax=Gigantopelta aegis TaxID=1735272 RepID=UPI001B88CE8A|nr:putative sodium-coupled neutral amino acid transporter 10 [Gigantopelta aegis]
MPHTQDLPYVINLGNSIIGVSVLAMPFCFKQCGIILGVLLLLFSTWLTLVSCQLLVKAGVASRRRSYEFLAYHLFGPAGKFIVEVGMIGLQIGTLIAQVVVVGDLGPAIVSKVFGLENTPNLRTWLIICLCLFIGLPLGLLKDLRTVSHASTICMCFYAVFIIYVSVVYLKLFYTCRCNILFIYLYLSSTVGFFGYIAFYREEITGDIITQFPATFTADIMKMCFVFSIVITFPVIIFPCRSSLYTLLFPQKPKTHEDFQIDSRIPELTFKMITVAIVFVSMVVGILVPNVEFILGMNGATVGTLICYIFPALFFVRVMAAKTEGKILAQLVMVFGVSILIVSTFTTLYSQDKGHTHAVVPKLVDEVDVLKPDIQPPSNLKTPETQDAKRIEPPEPKAPDDAEEKIKSGSEQKEKPDPKQEIHDKPKEPDPKHNEHKNDEKETIVDKEKETLNVDKEKEKSVKEKEKSVDEKEKPADGKEKAVDIGKHEGDKEKASEKHEDVEKVAKNEKLLADLVEQQKEVIKQQKELLQELKEHKDKEHNVPKREDQQKILPPDQGQPNEIQGHLLQGQVGQQNSLPQREGQQGLLQGQLQGLPQGQGHQQAVQQGNAQQDLPLRQQQMIPQRQQQILPQGQGQQVLPQGHGQQVVPQGQGQQVVAQGQGQQGQGQQIIPQGKGQQVVLQGQGQPVLPQGQGQQIVPQGQGQQVLQQGQRLQQQVLPQGQGQQVLPQGQGQQVLQQGQRLQQQVLPQGQGQQALPQGQGQQALPQGQGQHALPQGQGQQALPQGQGQQALPQGQRQQALPQGQGQQVLPQGQGLQQAVPQGQGQQALPQGQGQQALPQGQGQQALPQGQGQQNMPQGQGQQNMPQKQEQWQAMQGQNGAVGHLSNLGVIKVNQPFRDQQHNSPVAPADDSKVKRQKRDITDLLTSLNIQADKKDVLGEENKQILSRQKRNTDQSVKKIQINKEQIASNDVNVKAKQTEHDTNEVLGNQYSVKAPEIQNEKDSDKKTQIKGEKAEVKDGDKKQKIEMKRKLKSIAAVNQLTGDKLGVESHVEKIVTDDLSHRMAAFQMSRRR